MLRTAAQQHPTDAAAAVRSHDNQVGLPVARFIGEAIFQLGTELAASVRQAATSASRRSAVGITDGLPKAAVQRLLEPMARFPEVHLQAWEYGFRDMLAALALHRLDVILADRTAPPNPNLKVFNHRLGAASIQWYATPALRATSRSRFPKCLGELPLLLPTQDMALRERIDQWLEERSIRPRIIGEFADSGLIATFGTKGMGAFPATGWSREDLTSRQGLKLLGSSPEVSEQFFAISAERRIQDPLIQNPDAAHRVTTADRTTGPTRLTARTTRASC